ncbi:MAG: guanylate kinase [Bacilli bacterium]|nr:guanylate kinase [Bacilli bacterium]
MKKPGLLIIIAGPSGVGKGTIRKKVMENKKLNLVFSISLTTRKKRVGEKNGADYFFVTKQKFLNAIKNNDLLEYNNYVGNYYGTSKKQVNQVRKAGKNVILEIDVNGAKNVAKAFKKNEILSFFIVPPSLKELEKRIRGRSTETDVTIKKRLAKAKEEMKLKNKFNYIIVNDTPERASQEIINIIKNATALRG